MIVSKPIKESGEGQEVDKIEALFPLYITRQVLSIPLNRCPREDELSWPYIVDGEYNVKIRCHLAMSSEEFLGMYDPGSTKYT